MPTFPVIVDPTISMSGNSSKYFTVNATGAMTWNCSIYGGKRGEDYYTTDFYIYDPSGKAIVHRSTDSLTAVSYSGTVQVQSTQMGSWRASISGLHGGGQASITYPYLTPPVVTQVAPLNGAIVPTPSPEARWTFSDPDGHYQDNAEVQFCRDTSFGSGCLTTTVSTTAPAAVPPYALGNGVWYWRVRCQCSGRAWSVWSPAQSLTVSVSQPVIPGLLTVSEAGTNGSLNISWPAAVNTTVSGYHLDIGTTAAGGEFATLAVSGTSSTVPIPSDLILYATVRAIGPGSVAGPRSNAVDLRNLELHIDTVSSQTRYITMTQPGSFTWGGTATAREAEDTTYYGYMEISDPSGVVQVSMVGPAAVPQATEHVSSTQLGRWIVEVGNGRTTHVTADIRYIRNLAPTLKNIQIEGAAAEGAAVSKTTPLFQWQFSDPEQAGMGVARFTFSNDTGFTSGSTFTSEVTSGNSLSPSQPLTEGRWYWKSQVSDEWGMLSPWSPVRTLSIDLTPPTMPSNAHVILGPAGERALCWNASTDQNGNGVSSGIKGYYVYAGSQPGLFDLLNGEFVTGTSLTLPTTSDVPYCIVKAVDNAGNVSEGMTDRTVRTSWSYDEVGNRTVQTRNGATTFYQYNNSNQLTELTVSTGQDLDPPQVAQPVTFEYDPNGNLTKKTNQLPERTETWEYAYDDLNRLTMVTKDRVAVAAYAYDAFGHRVKAAQDGQLTIFIYSGDKVLYEETYAAQGDPIAALNLDLSTLTPLNTAEYVRGNGQLVAKLVPGPDLSGQFDGEVATYYHLDHLGSTRVVTDSQGNVIVRMDYEPFGALMDGASGGEHYGYTGQRNEDTPTTAATDRLGLHYYGARFYDPAIGRFITADSWTNLPDDERGLRVGEDPRTYNRYTYVLNSPLTMSDPSGHWGWETHCAVTSEWGLLLGFSERETGLVSFGNKSVDLSLDKWALNPLAWENHFDMTPGPDDSRINIARDKLAAAVEMFRSGKREQALVLLGEGLHSLQDVSAHEQLKPSEHPGSRADDANYKLERFLELIKSTKEYLREFLTDINRPPECDAADEDKLIDITLSQE